MRLNTTLSTLLLALCWILCSTTAFAQTTYTWTGGGTDPTDWQDNGNWNPSGYPGTGTGDIAQFTSGSGTIGPLTNIPNVTIGQVILNGFTGTVQIGADLTCDDITVTTGTLQINSGIDLAVTNSTTINGGTLTLNDPNTQHSLSVFTLSSGTFNGAGTVQMISATVSGGTFNGNSGDYTIDQNQQLAISGGIFNAGSGNYDLSINQISNGNVNITVFDHSSGMFNRDTSSFTVEVLAGGTGTKTATISTSTTTGFHNLTITSNNSGGGRVVAFAGTGTFTIHNELARTGRLTNVTGTNLQYASGATLRYNPNNNQSVFGEWPASNGPTKVIKDGSQTITLTASRTIPSGGLFEVNGGGFTIGGTSPITLTIALSAEARLTSGTLTVNAGRTLAVNGALRRNGGSLTNNGTLTYGTTGSNTINSISFTGGVLWYSSSSTTTYTISDEFPSSIPNLYMTNGVAIDLNGGTRTVTHDAVLNGAGPSTQHITNGTLVMGGSSAQTIGGTGTGTISNLTINNSSGVTLNRALTLTGTLTMTNGNLNTTTTNILTTPAISGGSASSFVNGPLSISGNSYPKTYPIGKSTAYRPISISGSGTATIRAEMINTPPTSGSLTNLARISQVRYFNVDLISGSVSSPTITINYEGDDGVADPPDLRVARSTDNNNWTSAGGTGSGSPSGSITSDPTTIASTTYFALGSITTDNPLPVQLSSFTLTPRQRSIELVWQTESESENKGFIILRSESATGGYQEIASYLNTPALVGQGTTASPTRYRYVDSHNLQPGRAYWYKLVDVDYSGRRHEHEPMSVQTAFEYALDQNYPNPFNPSTAIQFSLEKPGKTVLEIYNTLGQKVATLVNGELSAGAHRYQWNASGLASGVYFYRLQSNEFVATKKMLLVK